MYGSEIIRNKKQRDRKANLQIFFGWLTINAAISTLFAYPITSLLNMINSSWAVNYWHVTGWIGAAVTIFSAISLLFIKMFVG